MRVNYDIPPNVTHGEPDDAPFVLYVSRYGEIITWGHNTLAAAVDQALASIAYDTASPQCITSQGAVVVNFDNLREFFSLYPDHDVPEEVDKYQTFLKGLGGEA